MAGFKLGFFVAPKKQELTTSQKGQDLEKGNKKVTQQDKSTTFEEKPWEQAKNLIRSEVSNLTTQQQINYDQLIKVARDLKEEVKKLKKGKKKLMKKLELADEIESRLMTQKKNLMNLKYFARLEQLILKLAIEAERTFSKFEKIEEIQYKLQLQTKLKEQRNDSMITESEKTQDFNLNDKHKDAIAVSLKSIYGKVLEISKFQARILKLEKQLENKKKEQQQLKLSRERFYCKKLGNLHEKRYQASR